MKRFRGVYPGGFDSKSYRDDNRSRKEAASGLLQSRLPLAEAYGAQGCGPDVADIVIESGLLDRLEAKPLRALLLGRDGDRFIRAAARFTADCRERDLKKMRTLLAGADHQWTAATVLPFLWQPFVQMYLSPSASCRFARQVGHPFAELYRTALSTSVYASLLAGR